MVYRATVLFHDKSLQSTTIKGDELESISAIQDKQITDWFDEADNKSGWRGLISEIREQIGDLQAELSFDFIGEKEYKAIFEKCLSELGFKSDDGSMEEDKKKAVECYQKATEEGNVNAQYNLGLCYKNGAGIAKDEKKAVEWFRKAAEQGDADAQFILGDCYMNGKGVAVDEKKAVEWYQKAAEQGNAYAQNNLTFCAGM